MILTSETGSVRGRSAISTLLIACVAAALGVGVGLALVGLDLLPDGGAPTASVTPAPDDDCPDDENSEPLRIAVVPELAPALNDLAEVAGQLQESLRCRPIQVDARPAREIRAALSRGWVEDSDGEPPHVWIPTSSTEVALLRAATPNENLVDDDPPTFARSPNVIAMPQPMAEELGWPDGELTWNAVAKLAAADDAWGERGRDRWGPFTLSLVEDVESSPSIDAAVAITRAVGALPSGGSDAGQDELSAEEFEARAQLLLLERRVDYIGDTTQEQLERLRAADDDGELLETVSALPLTEQQLWRYNRGRPDPGDPPETPLVAWYPADGAPDADYPYVIVNGSWANESTTIAANVFLDVLQSREGQERLREAGFRDASREATPQLSEQETIRPDTAPPEPDAVPPEAAAPVLRAWQGLSQTGNLLAVVDVSGSMKTEVPGTGATRLELSAQGAAAGVSLLDPGTTAGIWEFSTDLGGEGVDHRELVPVGPFTDEVADGVSRQEAAVAALRGLRPREDTGLYDTIAAAYETMLENYQPGRLNAVIFFTDGKNDDDNGLTLERLQRRLREMVDPERPVLFLGVGYGPEADFEALNAVTTITDGKLYELERPEDIRNVFIDVQTGGVG